MVIKKLEKMESDIATLKAEHGSPASCKPAATQPDKGPVKGTKCKTVGHYHYAYRMGTDVECFRCGDKGHMASGCRNKKKDLNKQ